MLIKIKHRYTGEVLHSGEYADLRAAVIYCAKSNINLSGSNLRGSDLSGSNLRGSNLRGSDLRGSDLRGSNLSYSDLSGSDLRYSNLSGSNLRYSNLSGSNLRGSNLRGSDLRGSNLSYSDLSGSDLRDAKNAELAQAQTIIVPDGDLRVWKKCSNNVLVHLLIPADAKRSNSTGRKCRAEYADVLDVIGAEVGVSLHDGKTTYRKGERVTCDKWEENRFVECGGGVHFYLTRIEAEHN